MKHIMHADSHFSIGRNHLRLNKPCQDHALAGSVGEYALLAVADGCSTGRHTDIGARVTTCAVMIALKEIIDYSGALADAASISLINRKIESLLRSNRHMLGLEAADIYATCLYGLMGANGGFVHLKGDGGVIRRYRDGTIVSEILNWNMNMPYYPIYAESDLPLFLSRHREVGGGEKALVISRISQLPDGSVEKDEEYIPLQQALEGYTIELKPDNDFENLESITLCSDGIESFVSGAIPADLTEVIREMAGYRVPRDEFVKRRLSRLLENFSKKGIAPYDDIACAAIAINELEK